MCPKTGKLYPLEFTAARWGFPHFSIVQETHKEPCQWMLDLINGKDTLKASLLPTIGIIMCHPNFPYTKGRNQKAEGVKILGLTEENMKHIKFVEVRKVKGKYESAGEYLMVINGSGKTIHDAMVKAYDIAKYVKVPNPIVRDDVGEKMKDNLPIFQKFGIMEGLNYE
jgi:phosphoribosylamine-glycine ligase